MSTNQNYINEGVRAKLAFSSSKHNFLTTPPFSCLFTIIHLCRSSSIFYSTSFPGFSPTHLYEASGSGHECPEQN